MVSDYNGNQFVGYNHTETGNEWVIKNMDKFSLKNSEDEDMR